jgi:hypothetical protein
MIHTSDVAELVLALTRHATIPNIVVTRPGSQLWRASAAPGQATPD